VGKWLARDRYVFGWLDLWNGMDTRRVEEVNYVTRLTTDEMGKARAEKEYLQRLKELLAQLELTGNADPKFWEKYEDLHVAFQYAKNLRHKTW